MNADSETKNRTVVKTISLPLDMLSAAEAVAKEDRRTFSSYVQKLIDEDLKKQEPQAA